MIKKGYGGRGESKGTLLRNYATFDTFSRPELWLQLFSPRAKKAEKVDGKIQY